MRTIAIINQKGGCGKTTTAINLAGVLARRGHSVLLVDLDPQSHCAAGLGIPESKIDRHVGDALIADDERPIDHNRLVWRVSRGLDLVPSTMKLAGLEARRGGLADLADKEHRLSRALAQIEELASRAGRSYDCCLIDCPPSIGLLTYNALVAAKDVLIPVDAGYFALQGATRQINTVRSVARRLGLRIRSRLVPTMHDPSSQLAGELLAELRRRFPSAIAPAVVRFDPTLRQAAALGQPVIDFDPAAPGTIDYAALAEWLIQHATIERASIGEDELALFEDDGQLDAMFERAESAARMLGELSPTELEAVNGASAGAGRSLSEADLKPMVSRAAEIRQRADQMRARAGDGPALPAVDPKTPESIRRLFGARQTSQGLLFVQPLSMGRQISVVGDFNGWNAGLDVMHRNEELGIHELCIDIETGCRQYRLVVDGVWINDPHNRQTVANQYGGLNNFVAVEGQAVVA